LRYVRVADRYHRGTLSGLGDAVSLGTIGGFSGYRRALGRHPEGPDGPNRFDRLDGRTEGKEFAVVDDEPSGPQGDLWALPSEELPSGAAVFLDMARDLQAGLGDPASGWIGTEPPGYPEDVEELAGSGGPPAPFPDEDQRPALQLIVSPDPSGPFGEGGTPAAVDPAAAGPADDVPADDEAGARVFLEMVDRADTVRPIGSAGGGEGEDEAALPEWFWPGDEGIPASEVLLSTIEQAIRHVNQSEDIRSEEVRSRLLDLFTDFAVRRPWREEERPAAQRIQRLPAQPPEDAAGPSS
jgi:hypothetical protein